MTVTYVATRRRLDAELVRRGLARSRDHAKDLVEAGRVIHRGAAATKPATQVDPAEPLHVLNAAEPDVVGAAGRAIVEPATGWASRGAHKLLGALSAWPDVTVVGARCLDAGASTGGFTDVLLAAGARHVVAVDVGYGQLVWRLQSDKRVQVVDRTNLRTVDVALLGEPVDLVVADVSFISLTMVLPVLSRATREQATMLLMVKPQFEVGRELLPNGGVVRDPAVQAAAVLTVGTAAAELGWGTAGVTASPLPGPAGNREFFLRLERGSPDPDPVAVLSAVVAVGHLAEGSA